SGNEVLNLLAANLFDERVVGRPFFPVVVTVIVVVPVAVIFSIPLVVFVVVRNQIVERKPIVGGDEVNAVVGVSPRRFVQVAATCQPGGKSSGFSRIASPVLADVV